MRKNMNTPTDTKANFMQPAASASAGTYMAEAEAALAKIGIVLVNNDVREWLEKQQAARVPVSEIALRWKQSDNADLARETNYVVRLLYVSEELGRRVQQLNDRRQALSDSLQRAGVERIVDVAVEDTEALVDTAGQLKTLARIKNDLQSRMAADQPPKEIYDVMSRYVYSKLAETASGLRGRTTSWKLVAHTNSVLVALGDIASLFLDIEKI
jgi:hypothetical protein